jgi:hypothetical protein
MESIESQRRTNLAQIRDGLDIGSQVKLKVTERRSTRSSRMSRRSRMVLRLGRAGTERADAIAEFDGKSWYRELGEPCANQETSRLLARMH